MAAWRVRICSTNPHLGDRVSRLTAAEPGSTIRLGDVKLAVQQDQEKNMTVNAKARVLREKLAKGEFILAPGIYDGISARVADRMGFPALYMTGYGATASMLGLPDAGLATYSDMVGRAEMICSVDRHAADRRRRHRLRRAAERAAHGARLRGGGRRRDPDRGPGDAQEVRPHAGPPRRAGRGHGAQDQGRCRGAARSRRR